MKRHQMKALLISNTQMRLYKVIAPMTLYQCGNVTNQQSHGSSEQMDRPQVYKWRLLKDYLSLHLLVNSWQRETFLT